MHLVKPPARQMRYVNFHHHSTFSYGDGHKTPAKHVERAAELGYTAMALTEHGNVSSHYQLEKAALAAGIKPIFGLEAYTGPVDPELREQYKYHLTVIARTLEGYRNLNKIVTQSWIDYHYHPTVSGRTIADHSSGLAILSGCSGSLLACSLIGGKGIPDPEDGPNWGVASDIIERFRGIWGEYYFLEVQPFWELDKSSRINQAYELLSRETGVPIIVTCDVHYPRPEDGEMQAVLHAVHRGKASVDDAMREWNYEVPMTLPESTDALAERLIKTGMSKGAAWQAIENSLWLAERCNVTLPKAERLSYPISGKDLEPWT